VITSADHLRGLDVRPMFGSVSTMLQIGFIIGAGLLTDTFRVRTITVPALAAMIGPSELVADEATQGCALAKGAPPNWRRFLRA
jgi:uncharacterized membrane protein YdfJ with MMPL/SSD domain